ncbi:MAG TPA: radical SAM protein [Nitrospirae bacterium]|nr:antilisterial bacteriocin subtilosin biosynthesis protein AlbA [bacterium BMS3Abin10]GBE38873.1 antilisterial bacteriocin subtilosin biosynthesis protein AlbA [bacterium BMS3Bbin08]HDH49954.1 radical SAM protein [Nitrospirota bacterium]HDK17059.1 radical SAM protein [Nitrospirota bacterium]HDK82624.1 radical SAM protein [Nitrospirota bacterium]
MVYSPARYIGSIFCKKNPLHLTFFLTRRCNAQCPFCFYPVRKETSQVGQDKKNTEFSNGVNLSSGSTGTSDELTLEEIKKISSSMGRLLWLAFSGGEIFLRSDLVEITRVFYEKNKPAIILLPTNGLMPDIIRGKIEAILNHCGKSTVVVKLSLEGQEELHDSIRGKGSFQKTMQTYNKLGELPEKYPNFELGINTVFSSANQDSMQSLIEDVNKMGNIKTHTVSLIRGDVSDEGLKNIDINKYRDTINTLASNLRNKRSNIYRFRGARLKAAQDILQRRLIYDTVLQNRQLLPCYAGRLNLVLTESGDVYPCESFTPEMKMGSIKDSGYNIKTLLKTGQARKIVKSIKDNSCFCTHECYVMTNILFNPRMYPALFREYLKL